MDYEKGETFLIGWDIRNLFTLKSYAGNRDLEKLSW